MNTKRLKANPWWTEYLGVVIDKNLFAWKTFLAYSSYILAPLSLLLHSALCKGQDLPPVDLRAPANAVLLQGLSHIESAVSTTTSFRAEVDKAPEQQFTRGLLYKVDLNGSLHLESVRVNSTATLL